MINKKKVMVVFLIVSLLALSSTTVLARDKQMVSNSQNWQDVFSIMIYAQYMGWVPSFLVSDRHSTLLLTGFHENDPIDVISSADAPYVIGYKSLIESKGFTNVTEEEYENINLALAERLTDVNNYVILDDAYGYNAIAVGPYLMVSKSYALFANEDNIDDVASFLNSRNPGKVLIYGRVDRAVFDALSRFNPEVINNDGDRFANNIEIVKKYKEINDATQVLFSNGEFIESSLVAGDNPVLFIGNQNLPNAIRDYIINSNIRVGVLVGNDLVGTATLIRRSTGISTFVKFARSARVPDGSITAVEGLDVFPLPVYQLDLSLESVRYNTISRKLEVTYKNNVELATFFKGTYTIKTADGQQTVGDAEAVFIDKGDTKTLLYDIEPITATEGSVKVYTIFGEAMNSLERVIDAEIPLEIVSVADDSEITLDSVTYNKRKQQFEVGITNIGQTDVYVDTELLDVRILGERMNLGADELLFLKIGESGEAIVLGELSDEELQANKKISARAYYGEREDALVKIVEGEFELAVSSFDIIVYLPIIAIVALVLLIVLSRKKPCHECGHKNKRSKKHCKKCGARLKKKK